MLAAYLNKRTLGDIDAPHPAVLQPGRRPSGQAERDSFDWLEAQGINTPKREALRALTDAGVVENVYAWRSSMATRLASRSPYSPVRLRAGTRGSRAAARSPRKAQTAVGPRVGGRFVPRSDQVEDTVTAYCDAEVTRYRETSDVHREALQMSPSFVQSFRATNENQSADPARSARKPAAATGLSPSHSPRGTDGDHADTAVLGRLRPSQSPAIRRSEHAATPPVEDSAIAALPKMGVRDFSALPSPESVTDDGERAADGPRSAVIARRSQERRPGREGETLDGSDDDVDTVEAEYPLDFVGPLQPSDTRAVPNDFVGPLQAGVTRSASFRPLMTVVTPGTANSDCGDYTYKVKWGIPASEAAASGWIVQKVNKTVEVTDCDDKPVTPSAADDPAGYPFWEAWEFTPGQHVWVGPASAGGPHSGDTFGGSGYGPGTKGKKTITGEIKAIVGFTLPAGMAPRHIAPAWDLPYTRTEPPQFASTLPGAAHTLTSAWNCCPSGTVTSRTTVTTNP